MKKFLLIIPLTILLSYFFIIPSKANSLTYTFVIAEFGYPNETHYYHWTLWDSVPTPILDYRNTNWYKGYYVKGTFLAMGETYTNYDDAYNSCIASMDYFYQHEEINGTPNSDYNICSFWSNTAVVYNVWFSGMLDNQSNLDIIPDTPPAPEPGTDWLSDMWEWFLWQLGINDDYSGDIDVWVTGGDREPIEYVTPTPSPIPPTPTPYDLNIIDPSTGQPVYEITGIPGSTTIINGGDTYNGSDFDIFSVDLQIGDGGTSNPKDGLNSVMDASNDYLKDVDISPVQNSFSIIPNDWFLLIGVLAALPFIAGFIMRLLK